MNDHPINLEQHSHFESQTTHDYDQRLADLEAKLQTAVINKNEEEKKELYLKLLI